MGLVPLSSSFSPPSIQEGLAGHWGAMQAARAEEGLARQAWAPLGAWAGWGCTGRVPGARPGDPCIDREQDSFLYGLKGAGRRPHPLPSSPDAPGGFLLVWKRG